MKKARISVVMLLCIALISGIACSIGPCGACGKYIKQGDPEYNCRSNGCYFELFDDGTWMGRTEYGSGRSGTWEVDGHILKLNYIGQILGRWEIQGNTITDSEGYLWVKFPGGDPQTEVKPQIVYKNAYTESTFGSKKVFVECEVKNNGDSGTVTVNAEVTTADGGYWTTNKDRYIGCGKTSKFQFLFDQIQTLSHKYSLDDWSWRVWVE